MSKAKRGILLIFINLSIITFWLVMMGFLVKRELITSIAPRLAGGGYKNLFSSGLPFRQEWMGIYYNNEKVGYSSTSIGPYKGMDYSGYTVQNRTYLKINMLGEDNEVQFQGFIIVDDTYRLKKFNFFMNSGIHRIKVDGNLVGKTLDLVIDSGNTKVKKKLTVEKDLLLTNTMAPFLTLPELIPGKSYFADVIDPLTLGTGQARIKVTSIEKYNFKDRLQDVYVVEMEYKGIKATSWINEEGEILRQETPLGWVMVKENQEEAVRIKRAKISGEDMLLASSIPSNKIITNPREVKYMKVHLQNHNLPDSLKIIEIFSEGPLTNDFTSSGDIESRHTEEPVTLLETAFVQSDNAEIILKANDVIGGEKDPWAKSVKIGKWLYLNIRKVPSITIPSAVEVLYTMEGDCNEHTTLFTAMARAVGIPAKMCVGLVYHEGRFYYHAWPSVFVGRWVNMDPTFGQDIADATHINLFEGGLEKQAEIASLVGKLKINVIEYK